MSKSLKQAKISGGSEGGIMRVSSIPKESFSAVAREIGNVITNGKENLILKDAPQKKICFFENSLEILKQRFEKREGTKSLIPNSTLPSAKVPKLKVFPRTSYCPG